jgi:hypothetical protein
VPILDIIKWQEDIRVGKLVVDLPGELPVQRAALHVQHDVGHHPIQHQQGQQCRAVPATAFTTTGAIPAHPAAAS